MLYYLSYPSHSPLYSYSNCAICVLILLNFWTFTVLKEKLLDFFAKQTDFSKRLTSWKANLKFENAKEGKTLKGFVQMLKQQMGIETVYVWHALGGYWYYCHALLPYQHDTNIILITILTPYLHRTSIVLSP